MNRGGLAVVLVAVVVVAAGWGTAAGAAASGPPPVCPPRTDASEAADACPCAAAWTPTEAQLAGILAAHREWRAQGGLNAPGVRGRAVLCRARLVEAALAGADLRYAVLAGADLGQADLRGADLRAARLAGARLIDADLAAADLGGADLEGAVLIGTDVGGARLPFARLHATLYAPASPPPDGYLEGIEGLATVVVPPGRASGLVQLRERLQRAGLRDLERQATFAIEHNQALHARRLGTGLTWLGGWLRLVLFEWTTGWGLAPSRALLIIAGLMVILTPVYAFAVWNPPPDWVRFGEVVRVRPADRLARKGDRHALAGETAVEPLTTVGFAAALAWGFYFSMLSAFRIGWRDVNVGMWIAALQPAEFTLRGSGWVRAVSGAQSLISVYLVALWALTYFARPFQ